jgi:hypothetical protein
LYAVFVFCMDLFWLYGFGGGIGLFGDTCGALAGCVMAVSAVHGRPGLPEGEDPKALGCTHIIKEGAPVALEANS